MSASYFVVHGIENRDTCPQAAAFEADEELAEYIRKHPECMGCSGKLEVKKRAEAKPQ